MLKETEGWSIPRVWAKRFMTKSDRAMILFAVFEGNRMQRDLAFAQYFQVVSLEELIGMNIARNYFQISLDLKS